MWTLIPIDNSLDMIQVVNAGVTVGCLPLDAFRDDDAEDGGPLYRQLWRGEEAFVTLSQVVGRGPVAMGMSHD